MNDDFPTEHESATDLGRRLGQRHPQAIELDSTTAVWSGVLRNDEVLTTHNFEAYLPQPLRPRGTAQLHSPDDFADYVIRLGDVVTTTVWADITCGSVVAVINDHIAVDDAGWRDHRVVLALQEDPDWTAWVAHSGGKVGQMQFAEFIEAHTHCVVHPDAATMLEVATSLQAHRSANFGQSVNLTNSDVQLTWSEETEATAKAAGGKITVPREFTVRLSPWLSTTPVEVTARLTYSLIQGVLKMGYVLIRADLAKQAAFNVILDQLRGRLNHDHDEQEFPLLLGVAPQSQR